jgi:hypothetical protein
MTDQSFFDIVDHVPATASEHWQAASVWTRNLQGGLTFRSDRFPCGVDIRPNQDPADVIDHIASAFGWNPADVVLSTNPR